jgi:vacuole morphology and inheritance protein 14
MYNIAKVAKGEILVYFNQVFDALCKVGYYIRRMWA